jgi:hypothetical protein
VAATAVAFSGAGLGARFEGRFEEPVAAEMDEWREVSSFIILSF